MILPIHGIENMLLNISYISQTVKELNKYSKKPAEFDELV